MPARRSARRCGSTRERARARARRAGRRAAGRWRTPTSGPAYDDAEIERSLAWAKLRTAALRRRRAGRGGRRRCSPRTRSSAGSRAAWSSARARSARARSSPRRSIRRCRCASTSSRTARTSARSRRRSRARTWPTGSRRPLPTAATSPFMLFVYDVPPGQATRIPSACHTDRTARVQTVDAETNPRFHALLRAFARAHRRAGARQHLVQRARRADRRLAQGRDRGVLQHAARRARDRPLHRREGAMSSLTHGGTTPTPPARARAVVPAFGAGGVRVSVVIPTFRRPALIVRCLDAVIAQRLDAGAFEVIVVDDGRTRRHAGRRRASRAARPGARDPLPAPARRPRPGGGAQRRLAARARAASSPSPTTTPIPDPRLAARGERALDADVVAVAGRVVVPPPNRAVDGAPPAPTDHELMTRGLESAEFVTANAFVRRSALVAGRRLRRALQARLARGLGPAVPAARASGRDRAAATTRSSCIRCGPSAGA